jgi:hypothetical protein
MRTIILHGEMQRLRAKREIDRAPPKAIVRIVEAKRTTEQNDRFWAMLTDISKAEPMGRKHTPDDWKAILMNACGWECQFIEGLDGRPFPQGFRSSNLTKSQMTTLIEYMFTFGAEHQIRWSNESEAA